MAETDAPSGTGPLVFISYAHDDERHKDDVLRLARFLTTRSIRVELDIWNNSTRRDWPAWITDRLGVVDYVLVIASSRYREVADGNAAADLHRGVQFEAAALRDLLYANRQTWLPKLLPVLLPGHDLTELPLFLQPYTASHFRINTIDDAGTEELLRVLTGQPRDLPPSPGAVPVLLPSDPDDHVQHNQASARRWVTEQRATAVRNSNVTGIYLPPADGDVEVRQDLGSVEQATIIGIHGRRG